jgi:hypothetical protein
MMDEETIFFFLVTLIFFFQGRMDFLFFRLRCKSEAGVQFSWGLLLFGDFLFQVLQRKGE